LSSPRQGVLLWEIPLRPELPQAIEQRCRELLSQMLLAAVTDTTTKNEEKEEYYEREDSVDSH
jgi:hypothetical protein